MSAEPAFRIAVIGLGFGVNHVRLLSQMPGVEVAAVCDQDPDRLEQAANAGIPGVFTDYKALICDTKLDAVVVALPVRLHEDVTRTAIDAGLAVLVEKPLAPCLADGRRMVEHAASAGVALMPGHLERFNPAVQELARRVRAGEIGRVLQMTARRMGPIVIRTKGPDVNIIHDSALHDIDVMRFVLGSEVERVYAESQSGVRMPFEDSLAGLLRFRPEGDTPGAVGSLEVNWLAPERSRTLTVLGESGMFLLNYTAQTLELRRPAEAGPVAPIHVAAGNALQDELEAFISAVRSGAEPPVTPHDGLAALAVCDALTQSARTGMPVAPESLS